MPTPYLIADSAQVTVLRSLASTAFGKYSLALPEGVDLEDVYEVSAAGNELAYVSSLGSKRRVGGMFRRFVRADVNITAQGEDMVPASDVERVLDEAAKRVSGDFFLESDITRAGLGPWVPMVDFQVGDIANVEIWGRVVPLAVTRIEPKRTDHSDNDWSVHVGGQLLSDSEARLAENTDIYNAVVSDRRELAGLDGKIRTETNNRKADVESVRGVLTGEGEGQEDLLASLAGLNEQLQKTQASPQPGLIPAYIALNTRLWEVQQEVNAKNEEFQRLTAELDAQQSEQIEQMQEVQKQQALESQGRMRELMATPGGTSDPNVKVTREANGSWRFSVEDAVKGSMLHAKWYKGTFGEGESVTVDFEDIRVIDSDVLSFNPPLSTPYIFLRWAEAQKKQVTVDRFSGPWSISRSTWSNVLTVNAPAKTAEQVALRLKVTWSAATYDDTYGIRIRAGGRVLQERMMEHLGPWSFLENGRRWMSVTVSNATVEPGEDITVDVYSTATLAGGRRVEQVELTGTWIEEV
ncbi:hypothetical protein [Corynebacterium yonathiae]|uniref:Uncharacterized protein n=1 Tax=Corynebacterium yonathiae TaxID=2913504 RepID=A0A9X3M2F6_9CORY|nr:hypothetical protein [Corynebacterium yonathiae]MCZ9297043.1 hypothetical protein [Corynebacterium yonathiae]